MKLKKVSFGSLDVYKKHGLLDNVTVLEMWKKIADEKALKEIWEVTFDEKFDKEKFTPDEIYEGVNDFLLPFRNASKK